MASYISSLPFRRLDRQEKTNTIDGTDGVLTSNLPTKDSLSYIGKLPPGFFAEYLRILVDSRINSNLGSHLGLPWESE